MLNKPSIAIIIDCWDTGVRNRDIFRNIVEFVSANDHIETIVLASYECTDYDELSTVWYSNYTKMFRTDLARGPETQHIYAHRKHWEQVLPKELLQRTDPNILYIKNEKYKISLIFLEELEYFLSKNTHIENIFVLGEAWDGCVRDRPLGYKNLTKIQNVCILTKNDCVKTMNNKFPDLSSDNEWEEISDGIYVLGNKLKKVVDN